MVDRMISPFTLLSGPLLFTLSLFLTRSNIGHWYSTVSTLCLYFLWVLISRTLRILPHFYRCPGTMPCDPSCHIRTVTPLVTHSMYRVTRHCCPLMGRFHTLQTHFPMVFNTLAPICLLCATLPSAILAVRLSEPSVGGPGSCLDDAPLCTHIMQASHDFFLRLPHVNAVLCRWTAGYAFTLPTP